MELKKAEMIATHLVDLAEPISVAKGLALGQYVKLLMEREYRKGFTAGAMVLKEKYV